MKLGLTISVGLHGAMIAALWVGLPTFGEPMAPDQPMPVEVVTTDAFKQKTTPTKPEEPPSPEPKSQPAAKTAAEPKAQQADADQPKPDPAPEPASQQADAGPSQPDPAPEPPAPETASAGQPEAAEASGPASGPSEPGAPTPRPKPDTQLAKASEPKPASQAETAPAPEPEPQPEPKAQPEPDAQSASEPEAASEPEPKTQQAEAEATPTPPKPKPKPKPDSRVKLDDKPESQDTAEEDQLTSILKDVESELGGSSAGGETDTQGQESRGAEPGASQQAKAETDTTEAPSARQQLTASQIANVRRQLQDCWSVPAGAKDAANLVVEIAVTLNRDGSVRQARIATTERMNDSFYRAAAESALRAVHICSPLEGLPVEKYDTWRNMRLTFDPEQMFGS